MALYVRTRGTDDKIRLQIIYLASMSTPAPLANASKECIACDISPGWSIIRFILCIVVLGNQGKNDFDIWSCV